MSIPEVDAIREVFVDALRSAHAARRGLAPAVEVAVRAYARAMRESGVGIAQLLVEVKGLVRVHTGHDEPVYTPRVVGWAVAGFFDGAARKGPPS